jgi:hypothetical protein
MKDKWMNIGYEDDELKPYVEPPPDINDPVRIGNVNVFQPRRPFSFVLCYPVYVSNECGERGLEHVAWTS